MIMTMSKTARTTAPPTAAPIIVPLFFSFLLAPVSAGAMPSVELDDVVVGY